jgi:hypothetical protein
MRILAVLVFIVLASCADQTKLKKANTQVEPHENLIAILDTIWRAEQLPIQMRDSMMRIHGVDSKEAEVYQKEYRKNHSVNIIKIKNILAKNSWPEPVQIGETGNLTICNVL